MKGKRCVVCDRSANHFEHGLAYCRQHTRDDLKRQCKEAHEIRRGDSGAEKP